MSFKIAEYIVRVPIGHTTSPDVIKSAITTSRVVSGQNGVVTVHIFEYADIHQVIGVATGVGQIVIVSPESVGCPPTATEVEYCDKLNELFAAKKYIVLSVSHLHTKQSEQNSSQYLTRIIRDRPGFEAHHIIDNCAKTFQTLSGGWNINSGNYVGAAAIRINPA